MFLKVSVLAIVAIMACASVLWATDIRGRITSISVNATNSAIGSVSIDGKMEKDTGFDRASVRITAQTTIVKMKDGKKSAAKFSDLKVGQTVESTFTGPVAESYPVQAAAKEVVIIEGR